MSIMLKTTKKIENQIEQFLDTLSECASHFEIGIDFYLVGKMKDFEERVEAVRKCERKGDELRVEIERYLYENTLIPENIGDVLAILENSDEVLDNMKDTILQFSIEKPFIPENLSETFAQTTKASIQAVEMLTSGVRSFFVDLYAVNNYIQKVYFYEKEADRLGQRLNEEIFGSSIDLANKIHLSYFAGHVESISDYAQAVCDRMAIYVIKRQL